MEINKKLYQIEVPIIDDAYYQLNKHGLLDYYPMKFIWKPKAIKSKKEDKKERIYFDDILFKLGEYSQNQADIINGMGRFKLINSFVFKVPENSQKNAITLQYKDMIWNKIRIKPKRKNKIKFPEFEHDFNSCLPLHLISDISMCFVADNIPMEGIEVSCFLHGINSYSQEKIWNLMTFQYKIDNNFCQKTVHFQDQKIEFYSLDNMKKTLYCSLYQKAIIPLIISVEETILEIHPPINEEDNIGSDSESGKEKETWKEICKKAPGFVKFKESSVPSLQGLLGLLLLNPTTPEEMIVLVKKKEECKEYLEEHEIKFEEKKYFVEGENHKERLNLATHQLSLKNVRTVEMILDMDHNKRKKISEHHINQNEQKGCKRQKLK